MKISGSIQQLSEGALNEEVLSLLEEKLRLAGEVQLKVMRWSPGDFGFSGAHEGGVSVTVVGDTFLIKDQLKKAGLRWDKTSKRWHARFVHYDGKPKRESTHKSAGDVDVVIKKASAIAQEHNKLASAQNVISLATKGLGGDKSTQSVKVAIARLREAQRQDDRLQRSGVNLTFDWDRGVVLISGNTYGVKDWLVDLGFRWDQKGRGWMMPLATFTSVRRSFVRELVQRLKKAGITPKPKAQDEPRSLADRLRSYKASKMAAESTQGSVTFREFFVWLARWLAANPEGRGHRKVVSEIEDVVSLFGERVESVAAKEARGNDEYDPKLHCGIDWRRSRGGRMVLGFGIGEQADWTLLVPLSDGRVEKRKVGWDRGRKPGPTQQHMSLSLVPYAVGKALGRSIPAQFLTYIPVSAKLEAADLDEARGITLRLRRAKEVFGALRPKPSADVLSALVTSSKDDLGHARVGLLKLIEQFRAPDPMKRAADLLKRWGVTGKDARKVIGYLKSLSPEMAMAALGEDVIDEGSGGLSKRVRLVGDVVKRFRWEQEVSLLGFTEHLGIKKSGKEIEVRGRMLKFPCWLIIKAAWGESGDRPGSAAVEIDIHCVYGPKAPSPSPKNHVVYSKMRSAVVPASDGITSTIARSAVQRAIDDVLSGFRAAFRKADIQGLKKRHGGLSESVALTLKKLVEGNDQVGRTIRPLALRKLVEGNDQVGRIILKQLGGAGKVGAMIGAKQFMTFGSKAESKHGRGMGGLTFRFPNRKGPNMVRIVLNGRDLYDVEFMRVRGMNAKTTKKVTDVYATHLRKVFEKETGLYLSL